MPSSWATGSFHTHFLTRSEIFHFFRKKKWTDAWIITLRLHTWEKVITVMSRVLIPEQGNVLMQWNASATWRWFLTPNVLPWEIHTHIYGGGQQRSTEWCWESCRGKGRWFRWVPPPIWDNPGWSSCASKDINRNFRERLTVLLCPPLPDPSHNASSCVRERETGRLPRCPPSSARSSVSSGLPDKLMQTNQLPGPTLCSIHLSVFRILPDSATIHRQNLLLQPFSVISRNKTRFPRLPPPSRSG